MAQCEVPYEQNFGTAESEMMMQLLNTQYFDQSMTIQPDLLPLHDDASYNCLHHLEYYSADPCNLYESSPTNYLLQSSLGHQTYHHGIESMARNLNVMSYFEAGVKEQHASQNFTNDAVETESALKLKGKRKSEINCNERETSDESECISNNVPKKKSRSSVRAPRRGENCKEESKNGESSSCSSDEELNGESNRNYNTKKDSNSVSKANKGSATDPQSLYARKRREKINQRLRILQNLVPNGTKVDISTMLEEAIQYVKFLQTQIKLLSSDDLWMYAPLAYNGVNINIDLSVCQQ